MAPEGVEVVLPVPKGTDPAFWEPTPQDKLKFHQADLIVLNGAGYAKWIEKSSLPVLKMVNTSKDLEKDLIFTKSKSHSHGPEGKHNHHGVAATTWMDMQQAIKQALVIKKVLIELSAENKQQIENAYLKLKRELENIDHALLKIVSSDNCGCFSSYLSILCSSI
jgi:zinc transport system substrate-binding protein